MPVTIIFFTFIFFAGCKKNDNVVNTNPATNNTIIAPDVSATTDVANVVAAHIAMDNGGAVQDMADVVKTVRLEALNDENSNGMPDFGNSKSGVVKSYDSISGWWTATVTRIRGNVNGKYFTNYERVYKYQYLDSAGKFQKFFITNKDTAVSAKYQIVSGTGILKTPTVSDHLVSLTAAWDATGIDPKNITLNTTSPYMRVVSDTLTRNNSMRTLNGTLTVNFINIVSPRWDSPRGGTLNWHKNISGTIDGTYHAIVTFQKGATYSNTTIDKTFHIVFGTTPGVGEVSTSRAIVLIDNSKFIVDVQTGKVTQ